MLASHGGGGGGGAVHKFYIQGFTTIPMICSIFGGCQNKCFCWLCFVASSVFLVKQILYMEK